MVYCHQNHNKTDVITTVENLNMFKYIPCANFSTDRVMDYSGIKLLKIFPTVR